MMNVQTASRADLEVAIIEYDIAPLDGLTSKTTEELRAIVTAWVEAGDECEH